MRNFQDRCYNLYLNFPTEMNKCLDLDLHLLMDRLLILVNSDKSFIFLKSERYLLLKSINYRWLHMFTAMN